MRSYPVHEARADLSRLIDLALAGEPQRVTRRGREAVVIVSEREWEAGTKSTLVDVLSRYAGPDGLSDVLTEQPWGAARPLDEGDGRDR